MSMAMRVPEFLAKAGVRPTVENVRFSAAGSKEPGARAGSWVRSLPTQATEQDEHVPPPAPEGPSRAELERQAQEMTARMESSVARLRILSERLAAEARADAMEVALMVARRLIET